MSNSYQKIIIIGNLGADPEIRYTQNSAPVASFSVATSETWKDKQTGQPVTETEWHKIVCYQRLAEKAGEFLKKGSKVFLEGKLKTRKWQGQDGQDRYTTEIVAKEMRLLDPAPSQNNQSHNQKNQNSPQQQQQGNQQQNWNQRPTNHHSQSSAQPNPAPSEAQWDTGDVPF